MVRDNDAIDADLRGANRVGRVEDALDDEGARKQTPIAFEVAPGLRCGRGLAAAKGDDLLGAGAIAGVRRPVPQSWRAAEIGVDGIIVSNHGGRQLDQAPASLEALPAIKAAVGDRLTVMLDSGVRRGADILIAFCLGAQFVFFGRPTLYGAVAGGLPGVTKVLDIFRGEIDLVMGQIGCPSLSELGPDFLWRDDWTQNR